MTVYLIRHGETDANVRGAYNGRLDEPLCERGAAGISARAYPHVELLFASPMRRCRETAALIYPGMQPLLLEDLRERDFGDFEGLTFDEIISLEGFADWGRSEKLMPFPNAEDFDAFFIRCDRGFFAAIRACEEQNIKSAAIVCHGGVIRAVLSRNYGGGFYSWSSENGGGFILRVESGKIVSVEGLFE